MAEKYERGRTKEEEEAHERVGKKYFDLFLDMSYDSFYGCLVEFCKSIRSKYKFFEMGDDLKKLYDQMNHIISIGMIPKKELREFVQTIDPIYFTRMIAKCTYMGLSGIGMVMKGYVNLYDMLIEEEKLKKEKKE